MFERAIANFRPRPRIRTLDWARENIQTHEGRPYDHAAYPHLGNPGGPMDAFDCPQYLSITLQFASRLGKTFFGATAQMKSADTDPCPMMFASSDQKLATEVTERTYKMLEKCPGLRDQLRPRHRRRQNLVDLADCRIYIAWGRSVSTLADKAVRVGHANEVDKWEHLSTSKEADPLELFFDRFKEFPTHKRIIESTPALKRTSRIERLRLGSFNAAYYVPCPHCDKYQTLELDSIQWEKNEAGKSDKDVARATAHYVCPHCKGVVRDEHRASIMRLGVWVPEGCRVNDAEARKAAVEWKQTGRPNWRGWKDSPWIDGKPMRDGRDAGYQLSSLYALSLSWGDIAAKFVDCVQRPQNLRNFVNQWKGETWEIVSRKMTWEQVFERLMDPAIKPGVVPLWASLVTIGVDRQQSGDRHPYVVDAWGPGGRCATIAYGECDSLERIETEVAAKLWPHADKGNPVRASMVLIDSGNRPLGVHESCERLQRAGIPALPCKGSTIAMNDTYSVSVLGKNTSREGAKHCMVDTIRTQIWVDKAIHDIGRDADGGFAIYAASKHEHEDFIQQLLNDAPVEKLDAHNNARESWDRIDTSVPNDFRDCKRYSYVAKLLTTRNADVRPRNYTPPAVATNEPGRIRQLKIRGR